MRIGIIDIGSNTIHLDVFVRHRNGLLGIVDSAGTVNRLGACLINSREIPKQKRDEAVIIIARLISRAKRAGATEVRIFGTSIMREARNAATLVRAVQKKCGYTIDSMSAQREARCLAEIVTCTVDESTGHVLFVDIGGGSTEYVVARNGEVRGLWSYQYGLSKVVPHVPFSLYTEDAAAWLTRFFEKKTALLNKRIGRMRVTTLVGTSSVVKVVGQMLYGEKKLAALSGKQISEKQLRDIQRTIQRTGAYPKLAAVRTDLVYVGTFYFLTLMKRFGVRQIRIHPFSVREGYVRQLLKVASRK